LSAARNRRRDEGEPFQFGDQEPILKPPQAAPGKSRDGERCGHAERRFRQARSREASASEPIDTHYHALRFAMHGVFDELGIAA
jgi:hypothetical protein